MDDPSFEVAPIDTLEEEVWNLVSKGVKRAREESIIIDNIERPSLNNKENFYNKLTSETEIETEETEEQKTVTEEKQETVTEERKINKIEKTTKRKRLSEEKTEPLETMYIEDVIKKKKLKEKLKSTYTKYKEKKNAGGNNTT